MMDYEVEINKLKLSVSELQENLIHHWEKVHGGSLPLLYPVLYPVHPPAEQDCDKCSNRSTECWAKGKGKCNNFSAFKPKEDKPKVYRCKCGAKLEILNGCGKWWFRCDVFEKGNIGIHIVMIGVFDTEADLIAELEKLEAKHE